MTGRQWGPKQKLRAGYRTPSLQRTGWLPSAVTKMDVTCCVAFSLSSVVSRTFSAICVYSKCGHHPHPLGYFCAKFRFFRCLHCWVTHGEKSRTHSITQFIWCAENRSFRFGITVVFNSLSSISVTRTFTFVSPTLLFCLFNTHCLVHEFACKMKFFLVHWMSTDFSKCEWQSNLGHRQ